MNTLERSSKLGIIGGLIGLVITALFLFILDFGVSVGDKLTPLPQLTGLIGLVCFLAMFAGVFVVFKPGPAGIFLVLVGLPLTVTLVWSIPGLLFLISGILALVGAGKTPPSPFSWPLFWQRIPRWGWLTLLVVFLLFSVIILFPTDNVGRIFSVVRPTISPNR